MVFLAVSMEVARRVFGVVLEKRFQKISMGCDGLRVGGRTVWSVVSFFGLRRIFLRLPLFAKRCCGCSVLLRNWRFRDFCDDWHVSVRGVVKLDVLLWMLDIFGGLSG
jgi:hypothetical protein